MTSIEISMLIDTRSYQQSETSSEVCILGGGVAGITMALELARAGISCILIESGGLQSDPRTRDLNRGKSIGRSYEFADGCRSRYLGGSSNCWSGWCRPFEDDDLEERAWVPNSGWPIGPRDLERFQMRAHELLKLGPPDYDLQRTLASLKNDRIRSIVGNDDNVEELLVRLSTPVHMGKEYYEELQSSPHIRVFLYGNAVNVRCSPSDGKVTHVEVQTLSSRKFIFKAERYVLAMGGIENARLLLSSRDDYPAGVGNHSDLVGRYFMDHARAVLGKFRKTPQWRENYLFDSRYQCHNKRLTHGGSYIAGVFRVPRSTRQRESLLNAFTWLSTDFEFDHSTGVEALRALKKHKTHDSLDYRTLLRLLAQVSASPRDVAAFAIDRILRPLSWSRHVALEIICETAPRRESRVTLDDRPDELGMRRAVVNWVLGEEEFKTFERTFDIVSQGVTKIGLEMVANRAERDAWPVLKGTWHHMGTTRMDDRPTHGVVDRTSQVHGLHNFFVAGSSTFPTGGANYPTINLVAMALRLSETLIKQLRPRSLVIESSQANS